MKIARAGGKILFDDPATTFQPAPDMAGLIKQGEAIGLPIDLSRDQDIRSLQEHKSRMVCKVSGAIQCVGVVNSERARDGLLVVFVDHGVRWAAH